MNANEIHYYICIPKNMKASSLYLGLAGINGGESIFYYYVSVDMHEARLSLSMLILAYSIS